MQAIDAYTMDKIGIPSAVLMERAALSVVEEIERLNVSHGRVLIVVEGGNNGGDGLAVGRILLERGYKVDIYYIGGFEKVSQGFQQQWSILHHMGVRFRKTIPNKEYAVIVDGIFGVGLSREVQGVQKKAIEAMNHMDAIKVAIDEALRCKETGEEKTILFGLTGTGYFDMYAYEKFNDGKMSDYIPTDAELQKSLENLPKI